MNKVKRPRWRAGGTGVVLALLMLAPRLASGHAIPETANPPIEGVINVAPTMVEIIFSEEVVADGTQIEVYSLAGERVDTGDSALDLTDPERRRVTVGLVSDISPGTYLVQCLARSAIDDDEANSSFQFTYDPGATPKPGIVLRPMRPDDAVPTAIAEISQVDQEDDDSEDPTGLLLGLAVVAMAAALAVIVWRGRSTAQSGSHEHRS